jgi:hypothetical protein
MPNPNTDFNVPNLTDSQKLYMEIIKNFMSVNTAVNDMQNDVAKLNKVVLTGNGEIPLVEKVRDHTKFISNIEYWSRFLIGALLIQTITFFFGIIMALVRFLPILEKLASKP